ncbi:hypothetical protein BsWGS_00654 [Bradybaena similaris]
MSSQSSGRHRANTDEFSAEEEALSIISEAADNRLAAKKAFMAEAKAIRSKEIEKQQKESESEQDEICNDSTHDAAAVETDIHELEKKYKAAMVTSAQLDNENQSLVYQVELLKDQMEERDEEHTELQRHYKEKCREYDFQKRDLKNFEQELGTLKQQLEITSRLLAESGFIILVNDKGEPVLEKSSQVNLSANNGVFLGSSFLVSTESHNLLRKTEETKPAIAVAAVKKYTDTNQVSSSVDEVDGSTFAKVSDYSKDGTDRVILHGSNITTANEHEVLNSEPLQEVDGDRISSGSLVSQNGIVSECQETENSSFSVETSAAASLRAEPDSVEDEGDEFFDAISTPSPSSKTDSFNEQGTYDLNLLASESVGSSVDPEIRIKEAPNYSSNERQSFLLENVTETESSTDIIDESEERDIKENIITEVECNPDTPNQNENLGADSLKEVIECKGEQSVLVETSENSFTELEDLRDEKSASADDVGKEGIPDNKPEEEQSLENGQTGETLEHINKDSQEVFCDSPQAVEPSDSTTSHEEEVADVQNKSDVTESLSNEVPNSASVADVNLGNDIPISEETLQVHINKQEEQGFAEKSEDAESVDISLGTVSAENNTDVNNTQDEVEETGITESIVQDSQDISSLNGNAVLDVTHPTEIKSNDASEHPDNENVTETEDEAEQLSQRTQNLEPENNEESEENPICSEVDSEVISLKEDASCSVEHVTNDNMENNEYEEDTDSPVRDSMKLGVRTTSIGGSEASEGAVIDNYDFDDIDDVLNTDAPSAAGADLNTTPSSEAEISVLAAAEPLEQENKSSSKSPSNVVEKGEDTKAKGSKKSKSEKGKAGKKSNSEKAEKIKSGEKESKEKTEKAKNKESKEKTEKSKSSKKESSHEKKAEKSKNKKDVAQDSKSESVSGEEDKHSIAESQTSLEPDDLEGALDKQMLESEKLKSPKKSSKKLSIFKKVFK